MEQTDTVGAESGVMRGMRGVILGVANNRSIAWGIAKAARAAGAELALHLPGRGAGKAGAPARAGARRGGARPLRRHRRARRSTRCSPRPRRLWGSLDFVVHCIAFADKDQLTGRYIDTTEDNFTKSLAISCYSFTAIAQRAEKLMPNGGSMLTLTYYGAEKWMPHYNVMGVAKAALEASVRYLAADLGEKAHPRQRHLGRPDQDAGGLGDRRFPLHSALERVQRAAAPLGHDRGGRRKRGLSAVADVARRDRRDPARRRRLSCRRHEKSGRAGHLRREGVGTVLSGREDLCMSVINHQFRLAARRPVGLPERSDWSLHRRAGSRSGQGEFLVRNSVSSARISVDQRGWMNEATLTSSPVGIGEVMRAQGVGPRAIAVKARGLLGSATPSPDSWCPGICGLSRGDDVDKVDPVRCAVFPLSGRARNDGHDRLFRPARASETGAPVRPCRSGAAGHRHVVGQGSPASKAAASSASRAQRESAAISSANSGSTAAIDYKSETSARRCASSPKGIDVFFDNVGGDILDAALSNLARHARIVHLRRDARNTNDMTAVKGPRNIQRC